MGDNSTNSTTSSSGWDPDPLSDEKYIVLMALGSVSSILSIVGSSFVIYIASSKLDRIIHRILLGLSSADLVSSMSWLLMPYMVPSYLGFPGAIGTHDTCTAVGFFYATAVAVGGTYNTLLSMYHFAVVRGDKGRSWKEEDFSRHRRWEIMAHVFAVVWPIAVVGATAATESINPAAFSNQSCIINPAPWDCQDETDCQRSTPAIANYNIIAFTVMQCILTAISYGCTIAVWAYVRQILQKSNSHVFTTSTTGDNSNEANNRNKERLAQVSTQAILYALAFMNSSIWAAIGWFMLKILGPAGTDKAKHTAWGYTLLVLFYLCCPLQGALNFLIFTRMNVRQWRKREPDKSLFWIYRQILASRQPLPLSSTRSPPPPVAAASSDSTPFSDGSRGGILTRATLYIRGLALRPSR